MTENEDLVRTAPPDPPRTTPRTAPHTMSRPAVATPLADGARPGTLLMRRRFAGLPEQVGQARRFVALAVGDRAAADQAVLMTSELATNAVQHTRSGAGGFFEVSVYLAGPFLRVEVADGGGPAGTPSARALDPLAEQLPGGRGLAIVELCATRWGQSGDDSGRVVWFELPQD
ncbi:ATP-binding protein [Planomonospora corallina]|uniref:ATP-binding protein n=1 Tax=Planomonospora corallina TaxID=1806052 RepID=A0ABV8IFU4_9ACTN